MIDMNGIFRFYQDGKLICESPNNITETGRILAIKSLMGAIPNFGTSLYLGVGETANTLSSGLATNTTLEFKIASAGVSSSYLSNATAYDGIVFKARIDDPSSYRIKEAALYSNPLLSGATTFKTEVLVGFEPTDNMTHSDGTDLTTTSGNCRLVTSSDLSGSENFRIGDKALYLAASPTNSLPVIHINNIFSGLDLYENKDLIKLAFYAVGAGNVDVTFYTSTAYLSTYRFTAASSGYKVVSLEKGSTPQAQGTSGTVDWSNVALIKIRANTANMIVDGLRFENVTKLDTNNGMVSRTVLPTELSKLANTPLDIEYYLRLGFNG